MRPRVIAVGPLLCVLAGLLGAGCGRTAAPDASLARTRAALAQARNEVRPYADALTSAVRRSRLSRSPVALGAYRSCATGHDLVDFNYTVTVRADAPTTMSDMSRQITGLLRSEGWRLVSVDFAKVHLALADTDHPLYGMSQHGMKGAANILPYGSNSAGAVIFMHSPCLKAGSLAAQVERRGGV